MDSSEYIRKRVDSLTENSEAIREQSPVTNDFDSWSALKLILHSAAVNMYTSVLGDNEYFNDQLYYIDALAGSGVSTYEGDSCFLGSPIIAAKVANHPFKKMFLVEYNEDRADALKQRLEYVFSTDPGVTEPEEWEVINKDANAAIPDIVSEIYEMSGEGGFNYYCFVDNQETNVKWSAIEELTPKPWGDLLINIPTASAIGRNATRDSTPGELNEFYCMDLDEENLPDSGVRPVMKQLYQECLHHNGRPIQRITNIDSGTGSYEYDLLYATRETDGNNEYIKVIDYVKRFIEDVHGGDIDNILDVLHNEQASFQEYLPREDVDEEIPDEPDGTAPSQSGLGEFL